MPDRNKVNAAIEQFQRIIDQAPFQDTVDAFLRQEYNQGMDQIGVQFGMNFVPVEEDISFLQDYVNHNLYAVTDDIGHNLRSELMRGMLDGEDGAQLRQRVASVFKDKKFNNRMKMVMRTEKVRAGNMGRLEGAKQSGLNLKKYIDIVLDKRTTDVSKAMFKKYGGKDKAIPLDEEFMVRVNGKVYRGQGPPFMPNDRDTLMITRVKEE